MIDKELLYKETMKGLSSFYKEYMIDDSLLKTLTTAYMNSLDMLTNYANAVFANLFVNTAEATRQFPYMSFDASDSMYTLTRIARTPRINFYLGVPSSYTESEIIDYWRFAASPEVKTSILDMMGIYTEFVSGDYVRALVEGESEERYKGKVLNADVYHKAMPKRNNVDYVIKDNKFYILNLHEFDQESPYVTLKNITLDYNMSWLRTGSYLKIKYSDVVGKMEYNNLNKTFLRMASHGPILKDMKDSVEEMFPGEKIQMVDYFTRDNPKAHYWDTAISPEDREEQLLILRAMQKQVIARAITNKFNAGELFAGQGLDNPEDNIDDKGKGLSVHDFALCLPRTFAYPSVTGEDSKIDMLRRYLNVIKPADSYYYISWIEETKDTIIPEDEQELIADSLDDVLDTVVPQEDSKFKNTEEAHDTVASTGYATMLDYSNGIHADDSVIYWDLEYEELPESESELLEHVSLMYNTFPEAPIGLTANYTNGEVVISFQNTGAGASYYEVLRNDTVIEKVKIPSNDRNLRLSVRDKRFTNIKTDKYQIRTVFLEEGNQDEQAEYSHFSVVSVTA